MTGSMTSGLALAMDCISGICVRKEQEDDNIVFKLLTYINTTSCVPGGLSRPSGYFNLCSQCGIIRPSITMRLLWPLTAKNIPMRA